MREICSDQRFSDEYVGAQLRNALPALLDALEAVQVLLPPIRDAHEGCPARDEPGGCDTCAALAKVDAALDAAAPKETP